MKSIFDKATYKSKLALASLLLFSLSSLADPLLETRYVTEIKRLPNGDIMRRADVRAAFKRFHPCPSTGKQLGACPGWSQDHTIPLACFGEDSVSNMAWIPTVAKSGWKDWMKDRYERLIYALGKGTPACKNQIVIINDKVY